MAKGKLKWFNADKGYGFIMPESGGDDVFLHITSVEKAKLSVDSLVDGQEIEYEISEKKGKKSAVNIRIV